MREPFGVKPAERILYLNLGKDGKPASSLNTQELYNWARKREATSDFMSEPEIFKGGCFWGFQPVICLDSGYRIEVPNVPEFLVNGIILSPKDGERPFVKENPSTILRESPKARPYENLFISHSSSDNNEAVALNDILSKTYETFIDLEDLHPGEGLWKVCSKKPGGRTLKELKRSDYLVLLESPESMTSGFVEGEWRWWLRTKQEGTLIPVMIRDVTLPQKLQDLKYIRYQDDVGKVARDIAFAMGLDLNLK